MGGRAGLGDHTKDLHAQLLLARVRVFASDT